METLIVHPENKEQLKAVKAALKELKVEFETRKSPYDPQFVEKIEKGEQEFNEGKYSSISLDDVWK